MLILLLILYFIFAFALVTVALQVIGRVRNPAARFLSAVALLLTGCALVLLGGQWILGAIVFGIGARVMFSRPRAVQQPPSAGPPEAPGQPDARQKSTWN